MRRKAGQWVTLRANPEEGWGQERAEIEEVNEMPWGLSYIVRVAPEYRSSEHDDGFREVTEEQFEI